MPFYAVAKGRTTGIFMTWGECETQVKGFSGARYKKFDSVDAAQNFIDNESGVKKSDQSVSSSDINNKRSYTSTFKSKASGKPSKRNPTSDHTSEDDSDSNESLDISDIINKQMDDIEKRLKGCKKNFDKIVKDASKKSSEATIQPKQKKSKQIQLKFQFQRDNEGYVVVYTDGACSSNGRKGARAGLGVYWGDNHPLNTSEPVSGRATNNCGEIQAATWAIKQAIQNGVEKLAINTDSQFLINSVTKWMPGWKRKGWKLRSGEPVKNEIDFKELDSIKDELKIKWNYVEAHKGLHGNEMADQLARSGAAMYNK